MKPRRCAGSRGRLPGYDTGPEPHEGLACGRQGDTAAQIDLGRLYWKEWDERYGWDSKHAGGNFELLDEAAKWLQKACEQNNPHACMMLCELEHDRIDNIPYYTDLGAEKEEAALRWYVQARELGHPHK